MPIRPRTTTADLKPWLPSDYSNTGWTDTALQTALDDGHDPRLIAAEVWEDFAQTLPDDGSADQIVSAWTNLDQSVTYGENHSPRQVALRQAKFHRTRAKVKAIRFVHNPAEGEGPQGLEES